MAHLLLLEVPGGNDFTILEDAVRMGHEVTFFTGDLSHYQDQGRVTEAALELALSVVEIAPFTYKGLEEKAVEIHARHPFDAVLCLVDIRLIDASTLAAKLGLRFLSMATASLMRDKTKVRQVLASKGIDQPRFALIDRADQLLEAVASVGYPLVVKPADGYGSQNVHLVRHVRDLDALVTKLNQLTNEPIDYGLGVAANNRFSVEQYIEGTLIGCDVFSDGKSRTLLGINEKLMFAPPSFAIRGSCFPSARYDPKDVAAYAFALLDAVGFDFGASHIELMMAADGFYLIEINPRLVSAQIPFQIAYALERSVYADLIDLHLGVPLSDMSPFDRHWFSAIRWIIAPRPGRLDEIIFPEAHDPFIRRVAIFKDMGDFVRPPISNGDRIGYVIAVGETQSEAEFRAESYIDKTHLRLTAPAEVGPLHAH